MRAVSETLQLDAAGACPFSYLLKGRTRELQRRTSSHLCSPYAPAHPMTLISGQSAAEPLEKLCDHWHQGTAVTIVTTLRKGVLHLRSGRARLLPCLWSEPKGVLRICGDSGDGDDANDGHLRAYSTQGALLYLVGPYPFTLTRRTRRRDQGAPYLCDL